MPRRRRILNHVRTNLVAYLALFLALSGTAAYAAPRLLVYSDDVVDGQVFSVDVADNNLTGVDIRDRGLTGVDIAASSLTGFEVATNSIPGFDIADNSLPGTKVADNTLTGADVAANSLTGADVADNNLTGADVADNSLAGADIAENTLNVADLGCQSGKVLGFARVNGLALAQDHITSWTSDPTYIDITNNCAGDEVLVRWFGSGFYDIKFVGNPAALAVATINGRASTDIDNIVSVEKRFDEGGYFAVTVMDVCDTGADSLWCRNTGAAPQSGNFTIMLP